MNPLAAKERVTGEEHVIAQLDDLTEDERASEAWEETPVAALPDLLSLLEELADRWWADGMNFPSRDLRTASIQLRSTLTSIQGSEA